MFCYRASVSRIVLLGGLVGFLTVSVAQQTAAQADRAQRRKEWQQRSEQRTRESIGVTDEEWQKLQPMIAAVQTLLRDATVNRGRRGGEESGQAETEVQKCLKELEELLKNESAKADDIATKLKALREAREKAQKELKEARDTLRKAVTDRQEAQLVMQGILD